MPNRRVVHGFSPANRKNSVIRFLPFQHRPSPLDHDAGLAAVVLGALQGGPSRFEVVGSALLHFLEGVHVIISANPLCGAGFSSGV